jgi:hypothetical protein
VCVKAAVEAERAAEAEAAERAAHRTVEMDKALAYQRDVDRSTAAHREAARRTETEHRIERRMTVRRQEAAIRAAMADIEATGNGDGAALQ